MKIQKPLLIGGFVMGAVLVVELIATLLVWLTINEWSYPHDISLLYIPAIGFIVLFWAFIMKYGQYKDRKNSF